jgi:hypothetical protein
MTATATEMPAAEMPEVATAAKVPAAEMAAKVAAAMTATVAAARQSASRNRADSERQGCCESDRKLTHAVLLCHAPQ